MVCYQFSQFSSLVISLFEFVRESESQRVCSVRFMGVFDSVSSVPSSLGSILFDVIFVSDVNSVQNHLKRVHSVQFAFLIGSVASSFSSVRGTGAKFLSSFRSVQFTDSSGPDY